MEGMASASRLLALLALSACTSEEVERPHTCRSVTMVGTISYTIDGDELDLGDGQILQRETDGEGFLPIYGTWTRTDVVDGVTVATTVTVTPTSFHRLNFCTVEGKSIEAYAASDAEVDASVIEILYTDISDLRF